MSTRSGRTIAKVQRFDPTSTGSPSASASESEEESPKKPKKAAAKKAKVPASKAAKGMKRKAGKENEDGTPKEKRPQTAYFLFMAEERPALKVEHPDFNIKEVAVELGARWKKLSAAKKEKFQAEAKKLSDAYKAKKGETVEKVKKAKK
ncbi:hypothetical protein SDRG_02799 [Saprolegnia diclina VS20]|uniref:HMG box domain-containing protein n=1 Tax=Saprolegnia diclina (strain VS20) TaxID=1156394 RepID=T0QPU9_SAPDV|nr:hypothetical protein SDRG_02799 [Saprolegnia diclina VS20]EQC40149.1 hypothetical protein SDRG_02799 [Saprolegnia diclina VS20]|eukprot:XP_008606623.1 hypothetical protein SDRG_02799 [Saprolegnia diclina VS20]